MVPEAIPTVLVADDNETNLALFRDTLEAEGYRVVVARNGLEAVAAFEREQPACVLLDVRMPVLDGFGACSRIRALPDGREAPIVFVTALRDLDTFEAAVSVGVDDFLTKPVRPSELVLRVQAALRLRRMSAERGELYALVRTQRDDLMRVLLQKERLAAFLVHDLRSPVSGIVLAAEMIAGDPSAPDRVRATAGRIRKTAETVNRLILDLLDISRSDEGRLTPRASPLDLVALVTDVVNEHAGHAGQVRLEHAAEQAELPLRGDGGLLRRVVSNLLDNATRHAPRGSEVRVTTRREGDEIEVSVRDRGAGVPEAMRERVFDRYVQAGDEPARAGRGLGLTFCKLVVDAHEGRIWVEDGAPGALFRVRLPSQGRSDSDAD